MHKADKQFLIEYRYAGATWTVDIWADDWTDAQRKLLALGTNGRVVGEAVMRIKVPGTFGRIWNWLLRKKRGGEPRPAPSAAAGCDPAALVSPGNLYGPAADALRDFKPGEPGNGDYSTPPKGASQE